MVKIILFIDDCKGQQIAVTNDFRCIEKYVESQGEEGKEEINKCHKCGW